MLKSPLKRIILYNCNFICVTKFDTRCPEWDKVTVTFVDRSSDKLIYALQRNMSSLYTRWIKFASHAQITFAPLCDKASIAKEWSLLIVMFSYEKEIISDDNCVTQFVTRCIDWDKVSVKFVARSDDILYNALQFGLV